VPEASGWPKVNGKALGQDWFGASVTVTVKKQLVVFPAASVATHETTLVPIGNAEPAGGVQTTPTVPPQLSVPVGVVKKTVAWHCPASGALVMLAGQTICGGWLSRTVTVKEQELELPEVSVATQLTVVVPLAKGEPEGGMQTGGEVPGQLSLTTTK